jgi:hypothetical protein
LLDHHHFSRALPLPSHRILRPIYTSIGVLETLGSFKCPVSTLFHCTSPPSFSTLWTRCVKRSNLGTRNHLSYAKRSDPGTRLQKMARSIGQENERDIFFLVFATIFLSMCSVDMSSIVLPQVVATCGLEKNSPHLISHSASLSTLTPPAVCSGEYQSSMNLRLTTSMARIL